MEKDKLTPLMRQYQSMKAKHPDKVMLFRMGDFYETFNSDAKIVSKVLNITLTSRGKTDSTSTPLAGFPYHALDTYLHKLLSAGLKVAICEQIEDPKKAKGIVKRDITEIVTPGVTVNDKFLNSTENNYLGAIVFDESKIAFAYIDISTGEFSVVESDEKKIIDLFKSNPTSELLINENDRDRVKKIFPKYRGLITKLPEWIYDITYSEELINSHFQITTLKGLGIENQTNVIKTVGAIFHYVNENFQKQLSHITSIRKLNIENYVGLDQFTIRNLELFQRLSGEIG
ncbi:MAG: DNA mismatch repair protein MutS, partial [Candidatus Marinimicrobia bacterium]|nr:DNA mismatch repair protein MutS [Candidatus Neomarinimicrobiota bacterium]